MLPSAVFIQKQSTDAQILTQQEPPNNSFQPVFESATHRSLQRAQVHSSYAYPETTSGPSSDVIIDMFLALKYRIPSEDGNMWVVCDPKVVSQIYVLIYMEVMHFKSHSLIPTS